MKVKNKEHFFRHSRGWFLFSKVIFFYLRLFYKKIVVEGKENIPNDNPVIFAPNHQNALMDPLVLIYANRMQTVFLARADVFNIPVLRDFFHWLKMLPVFRIRDGAENLHNNDKSFNFALEVLENSRSVGIFPEATHTNLRRLLPLKKGIPRLAFLAESKNNFSLGIKVVPVGIHYSDYEKMHSVVHIRFGKPIDVAQFQQDFLQNQQKAMLLLRDEISRKLSELTINIRDTHRYDTIYRASELLSKSLLLHSGKNKMSHKSEFATQLALTRILEEQGVSEANHTAQLMEQTENLLTLLDKAKVRALPFGVKPGIMKIFCLKIGLLLMFPVYLYGAVNGIPKSFLLQLLLRKFKDRQFHSSVKFLWGLAVAPLFFLIQAALVWLFTGSFFIGLAYLASLPLVVIFSKIYRIWFQQFLSAIRLLHQRFFQPQDFSRLYNSFKTVMDALVKSFQST
ncbi:MAG TPA: 1-acyl-sn-glycerol-3-phosphate acyltransferase [Bacteroidales bacterium]|nr:1-acyl-sn-glycerol-3-phosphate acyltransferase [Bacteroidales bacterium]